MNAEHFITFTKVFNAFEWAKENAPNSVTSFYGNGKTDVEGINDNGKRFRDNISSSISQAKVFEVDEGIKKLNLTEFCACWNSNITDVNHMTKLKKK